MPKLEIVAHLRDASKRGTVFVVRRIRRNWWLDRTCIVFLIGVGMVFGLSYYFMNVMANVASRRSKIIEDQLGTRYTLPDVFYEFIGYVDMLWMTDLFDALMFVPTALLVISHERPWRVVSRMGLAWALASVIRVTTVAITSVPDPRPTCKYALGNPFTSFAMHRCGDAIYSGHTLIFVMCAMAWASFAPKTILGRSLLSFIWALSIAGSLIVIANRAHYTIDVLLAWYIAPGAWYTVAWFWYWHVTKKGRLLRIEFPAEVGRHRDKDSSDLCLRRRIELGLMPDGSPYDPVVVYLNAMRVGEEPPNAVAASSNTVLMPPVDEKSQSPEPEDPDAYLVDIGGLPRREAVVATVGAHDGGYACDSDIERAFSEDFGQGR
ncbi:hypothetical protein IW138_005750 [Coemansia sp. RSA 986]|nr:hypothetical protein IW138_005750 [Coemansia sp. RSA 986]